MTNETETARTALKACQIAQRNHREDIRLTRAAIAEAEREVLECEQELGAIATAIAGRAP
jgi:hypothetical protein